MNNWTVKFSLSKKKKKASLGNMTFPETQMDHLTVPISSKSV